MVLYKKLWPILRLKKMRIKLARAQVEVVKKYKVEELLRLLKEQYNLGFEAFPN